MKILFRRAAAALFIAASCVPALTHAAAVSGQGTWETTLQGRDLDGNLATAEAYYDTALGITWLADANYVMTSGYDSDGYMDWYSANVWAAGLNPYGSGITGWRLPTTNPVDGTTSDDGVLAYNGTEDFGLNVSAPGTFYTGSTASEMAHMYYNTLGNKSSCNPATSSATFCSSQTGWGLTNTANFINIFNYAGAYWSATSYAPNLDNAWTLYFSDGLQASSNKANSNYAWAVHSGDVGTAVSSVPIPAAAWLFASGLLGLIGVSRKRRR